MYNMESEYLKEVKNKRLLNSLKREGLYVKIFKNFLDKDFVITDLNENVYGVLEKKSLRNEDLEELCTDIRTIVRGPLPEINRA